ncbi:MAG TPA: chaperone modulator CbpM [Cyclobacteriaceae bacterium]
MTEQNIISISTFCSKYEVPESFIHSLRKYQLLEVIEREGEAFIRVSHLQWVEKMMRLHYELDINMEGLDAISNLLQQIWKLQQENQDLKEKLTLYE